MDFVSVNPATEETLEHWQVAGGQQLDQSLDTAHRAARTWRLASIDERSQLLEAVAGRLSGERHKLALTATLEMGKPLAEALAEVDKCANGLRYYAEHAPAMLADEPHPSNASESYVSFHPLGVILAIMPWNFPYWQVFRHAAPALMAGNVIVIKHAENTQGCAHAIVQAFRDAGAPDGLVSTLVIGVEQTAEVIRDRRVAAVTLTGSTRAGASVAATAGGVWKKTVLELGGSDAFVVLDDADVGAAAATAVKARFQNTGQSCIAAKRFIVLRAVAEAFTDAFVEHVRGLHLGDPTSEGTTLGPMARADLRAELNRQYEASIAAGARVLLAGGSREGTGWFFSPAVLAVDGRAAPVWREEAFGPVAPITIVEDEAQALAVANDTEYGLGGNVWTGDLDRGKAFARQVESGAVFVNGMTASDPRLPFGGIKRSGYGRELAAFGLREFTNIQTVWVGPAADPAAPSTPSE